MSSDSISTPDQERNEIELVRFEKLRALRSKGFSFPNDIKITATTDQILALEILASLEECQKKSDRYTLAGRIVLMRLMGKAAFCHILDGNGKLQLYIKQDVVGEEVFAQFKELDIGDIIEAHGFPFITKTGEKSLFVEKVRLLTKSLIPLPEKWHGLSDVETRYRQRYVDLISNLEVRNIFKTRSRIVSFIRRFLEAENFLEVETPVLHYIAGGATAKPFKTHYNSLHTDMNLRIALELPLKKLVVGGLERVYEIGRVFRNEGLSKKHNPEFTMLEFYQAYATFEDLMTLSEKLISSLAFEVNGSYVIKYQGEEIDLTPPWPRLSMTESIYKIAGVDRSLDLNKLEDAKKAAAKSSVHLDEPGDWGRVVEALWGALVEPKLRNPVFITHHPFSISPLARKNAQNPNITDRFELIIAGMEMANALSELNDAEDQRARFETQSARKKAGDEEATDIDEDFLRALEYGLPPTAGEGIGIDRLVMLLTDSPSIRDVLLFPQLKPKQEIEEVEKE